MNLDPFIALIQAGEVVAFPTETVYGLGADAWNPTAINKIFQLKGRPSDNPLIVHIASEKEIFNFAKTLPPWVAPLIEHFWPGPLSLVLEKKPHVLDAITAGLNTVAIRMPAHPLALEFISQTGPLVAPSANLSGKPSPTRAEHVTSDFGPDFPVIDGEATKVGLESTVLDVSNPTPAILRPGSISRKEIEDVLDQSVEESFFHVSSTPRSPGQKYSHYKPEAQVRWWQNGETPDSPKSMYLLQEGTLSSPNVVNYHNDLYRMARELYDRFRQADHEGYNEVVIQLPAETNHPMYSALFNRISRAVNG